MNATAETMERLGLAADRVANLAAGLELPFSPHIHLQALRGALPELGDELRAIYVAVTGENPWEGQ